jgi:hypothetical protein
MSEDDAAGTLPPHLVVAREDMAFRRDVVLSLTAVGRALAKIHRGGSADIEPEIKALMGHVESAVDAMDQIIIAMADDHEGQ